MKKLLPLLLLALILSLFFTGEASAEIYRWVDENGKTHFSDTPPPDGETAAKRYVPPAANVDSTPVPTYTPKASGDYTQKKKRKRRGKKAQIDLYGTDWCPACKQAKKWLNSNKIPFNDYNIERSKEARANFRKLTSNGLIPLAVINGKKIVGFKPKSYLAALEE